MYLQTVRNCGDDARKRLAGLNRLAPVALVFMVCAFCSFTTRFLRGADLPTTPAPSTVGPTEYRLGPEDVIEVFVYKEPDLSTTVTVRPDGRISLPLAGELEASG